MTKEILRILTKTVLIVIAVFVSLIFIGWILMNWRTLIYSHDEWSKKLIAQCNNDFENCVVSADRVTNSEWVKMYVFREAVGNEMIEKILGFQYNNSNEGIRRVIIFVGNDQIVHEESFLYDSFEGLPGGSAIFEYDEGDPPFYIARDRKNARFQIKKDGNYFRIIPLPPSLK